MAGRAVKGQKKKKIYFVVLRVTSHHSVVDYFPVTAQHRVFYAHILSSSILQDVSLTYVQRHQAINVCLV